MNFIFWNIRGIGNNDSRVAFNDMCCLRNRWHNCTHRGLMIICSHTFREGNCCADGLATLGHAETTTNWFTILSSYLLVDFARVRNELLNYKFP